MAQYINAEKFASIRPLLLTFMCDYIECFVDVENSKNGYYASDLFDEITGFLCQNNKVGAIKALRTVVLSMEDKINFTLPTSAILRASLTRSVNVFNEQTGRKMFVGMAEFGGTLYNNKDRMGLKEAKDFVDVIADIIQNGGFTDEEDVKI